MPSIGCRNSWHCFVTVWLDWLFMWQFLRSRIAPVLRRNLDVLFDRFLRVSSIPLFCFFLQFLLFSSTSVSLPFPPVWLSAVQHVPSYLHLLLLFMSPFILQLYFHLFIFLFRSPLALPPLRFHPPPLPLVFLLLLCRLFRLLLLPKLKYMLSSLSLSSPPLPSILPSVSLLVSFTSSCSSSLAFRSLPHLLLFLLLHLLLISLFLVLLLVLLFLLLTSSFSVSSLQSLNTCPTHLECQNKLAYTERFCWELLALCYGAYFKCWLTTDAVNLASIGCH